MKIEEKKKAKWTLKGHFRKREGLDTVSIHSLHCSDFLKKKSIKLTSLVERVVLNLFEVFKP